MEIDRCSLLLTEQDLADIGGDGVEPEALGTGQGAKSPDQRRRKFLPLRLDAALDNPVRLTDDLSVASEKN